MLNRSGVRRLLVLAVIGIVISAPALAAQDPDKAAAKAAAKEARRAAFLNGAPSSKARAVVQPKTESEAVAAQRVVSAGIVEMQLPEDRMLELVEIKHADGSVSVGHPGDEARAKNIEEAVQ